MSRGRRPVEGHEVPYLVALGVELRALRGDAGLTQAEVAERATLTAGHLSALEHGRRRTRRSTLERIVAAVVADEDRRPEVVEHLVEVAGPGLAPESDFAERVERRRARRQARSERRYRAEAQKIYRRMERDARKEPPGSRAAGFADQLRDVLARDGVDVGPSPERPTPRAQSARRSPAVVPSAVLPPTVVEMITTEGLDPDRRARFERMAADPQSPNHLAARAMLALDDERRAS